MRSMMSNIRIGFLGAGKMATALAQGILQSGEISTDAILASDASPAARTAFEQVTGARTTGDNLELVANADLVVLAVKPQVVANVLTAVAAQSQEKHLFVSIAAGISLSTLEQLVPQSRHVRVMPNTPALVQAGVSAFARGRQATEEDAELVRRLLTTVGLAIEVPESQLDAVTGLSGSGPAYVFAMIEALSDGGVLMGLPRATATTLAAQTLLGAAKMVLETGEHPGALKDAVTSPGGTTIAGLHQLERGQLRGTLMNAVQAATERSRELGKQG